MLYLLWASPALAVIAGICGRLNTTLAALLGLLAALAVAVLTAPVSFGTDQAVHALTRGLWIGAVIAPYILGGLLFWRVAARSDAAASQPEVEAMHAGGAPSPDIAQRRLLFFACFLVGPFAEAATGFGVGMLGTVALIRSLRIAPRPLMILALLSQTMIPWGAMGSGTLLAATYARIPAAELGLYSVVPVSLLMLVWLPLFWRTARQSGYGAPMAERLSECAWTGTALALLAPASFLLGPEAALLTAYGPLIVLHYVIHGGPEGRAIGAMARKTMPYIVLIVGLVLTRLWPALREQLLSFGRMAPFDDLPAWSPLYHAGTWLLIGGLLTALLRRQGRVLGATASAAWATGKHAVMGIFLFAMLAEVLSQSGISQAFAAKVFVELQDWAIVATPVLASAFGILANTGNAPNSLFMQSQLALALQAGLSVPAVAALQHVAGTSMGLFSPVRMSIAASLSRGAGEERAVYGMLAPYAACSLLLLLLCSAWVVVCK